MSSTLPSQTARGARWLTNFSDEDVPAAQLLIDSLRIASMADIRSRLREYIEDAAGAGTIPTPTLLLVPASLDELPPLEGSSTGRHVAYETFQPGERISATPGSEGLMGHLIRDLVRRNDQWFMPPESSLSELREARSSSVVLLTDYVGSGRQLGEYAKTLVRNATIRSWRSSGLLRIHGLAYAAGVGTAQELIKRGSAIDDFRAIMAGNSFDSAAWSEANRAIIEDLCLRYVHPKRKREAFGFRGSRGLFATDLSVPNNIPMILRQTGHGWVPFFEERTVPADVTRDLSGFTPEVDWVEAATLVRQTRLALSGSLNRGRPASQRMLLVLALLSAGRKSNIELSEETGMSLTQIEQTIRALEALKMIGDARNLTALGTAELKSGRRRPRRVTSNLHGTAAAYYPSSMR